MRERHTIKEKIKSVHSCTLVCDIIITSKKEYREAITRWYFGRSVYKAFSTKNNGC